MHSECEITQKKTSKLNLLLCPQNLVMFIFLLLQLKLAFLGLEKLIHYGGEKTCSQAFGYLGSSVGQWLVSSLHFSPIFSRCCQLTEGLEGLGGEGFFVN